MELSLRNKFLIPSVLLVIIGMGISAGVSYLNSKKTIETMAISQIDQFADSAANQFSSWIRFINLNVSNWCDEILFKTAVRDSFLGQSSRETANQKLLSLKNNYEFFENLAIFDADGQAVASSVPDIIGKPNVTDQTSFQESIKGKTFISEVFRSSITGHPVFTVSAPMWQNKEKIEGVFLAWVDMDHFSKTLIEPIKIGESGYAYMYDSRGIIIAHQNKDKILKMNTDSGKNMTGKEKGFSVSISDGREKMTGFRRIESTGWFVAVEADEGELFYSAKRNGYTILFLAFSIVTAISGVIFFLVQSITRPFKEIFGGLKTFSSREIKEVGMQFEDVIGSLAGSAAHIAKASRNLADGTTEEASNIEETSSALEEISAMTMRNADSSGQADKFMKNMKDVIKQANRFMNEMTDSMNNISKASRDTSNIIKTIDEIAFQTNLLALNAAVEAARAGEAGAGFAVVADEVRNLAMRAANAAKNTSELIESIVKNIEIGSGLLAKTNEAYSQVVMNSTKMEELVSEVSSNSEEQAKGIGQVSQSVAEMDKSVQSNAAGAEELSSQSSELSRLVNILLSVMRGNQSASGNSGFSDPMKIEGGDSD